MIFPIGDDNVQGGHYPYVSYTLLVLNIAVFLYQISLPMETVDFFVYTYGAVPAEIWAGKGYYSLFTCMFLHGGWMHLIGNMVFLWVFADNIEAIIGSRQFLLFYVLGGLFASLAHMLFNAESLIPTIGASGAIAAVLGAYMVMFPQSRIKVIVIIFFFTFQMRAIWFLGIWIGQQLINGIAAVGPESAHTAGVAWWAHIGGFVFGVLAGIFGRRMTRLLDEKPPDTPLPRYV